MGDGNRAGQRNHGDARMKLKKVQKGARWYVLGVDGNRGSEDPFRMLIEPMNAKEHREFQRALLVANAKKVEDVERNAERLPEETIRKCVKQVAGLLAETGEQITTVEAMLAELDEGDPTIYQEVVNDIFLACQKTSRLDAGIEKKPDSPPFSSSAENPPHNGPA